jgi:prephenate dehydrogenase
MSRIIPPAGGAAGDGRPPFDRIAIVGYGLLGGSIGLAIKARWPSALIIAIDRKEVIEAVLRLQAADIGDDDLIIAAGAQLIVLAAPVRANIAVLSRLSSCVPGDALVTDVGSTKRSTVDAAAVLPGRLRFLGGHPLAGGTATGVKAARADLFAGRPWIVTPADGDAPDDRLIDLLQQIGATVHLQTPDEHDALVASLSHLPQFAATALMHVVGETAGHAGLALAGRGLRDTTRLAASSTAIWRDIAASNAGNIRANLDAYIRVLQDLRADLDDEHGTLARIFESGAAWKLALEQHFDRE